MFWLSITEAKPPCLVFDFCVDIIDVRFDADILLLFNC